MLQHDAACLLIPSLWYEGDPLLVPSPLMGEGGGDLPRCSIFPPSPTKGEREKDRGEENRSPPPRRREQSGILRQRKKGAADAGTLIEEASIPGKNGNQEICFVVAGFRPRGDMPRTEFRVGPQEDPLLGSPDRAHWVDCRSPIFRETYGRKHEQLMGYEGDVARKAAWQFLNKTTDPRLAMLRRFAKVLGISVRDLL